MNPTPLVTAVSSMPSILAHQGGWDEMLMILGPLAVVGGALWVANKRANQLDQVEAGTPSGASADGDD